MREITFRRIVGILTSFLLISSLLIAYESSNSPVKAAATTNSTACGAVEDTSTNIKVEVSHGGVFYIDSGVTPKVDASYIGYKVTNTGGSSRSGLWVKTSNFAGNVVALANASDASQSIGTLASSGTSTAFFLLKASAATTVDQTHLLQVFDRRPDLTGATSIYQCTFTFTDVRETIQASANKVDSVSVSTSGSLNLGQQYSVTVVGSTGQIGNGNSSPDGDIIWLSPSAYSSWPTRALRLESTTLLLDADGDFTTTTDEGTYNNQLLVTNASRLTLGSAGRQISSGGKYRAVYTFRVIGAAATSTKVVPVAQISSGNQIKHTVLSSTTSGSFPTANFTTVTNTMTATKSATSTATTAAGSSITGGTSGVTYARINYTATVASTGDTAVDEIIDTPSSSAIYVASSASITDVSGTRAVSPTKVSTDASSATNHFVGPFTVSATTSAVLTYGMWVPLTTGSYLNTMYAKSGDQIVGASASATAGVTVTTNGSGVTGTTTTNQGLPPTAVTLTPTTLNSTSATLAGQVDANSTSTSVVFKWGTAANALNTTIALSTITADTPTSFTSNLTGLTKSTTYYYEIQGTYSGSTVVYGGVQSFTTPAQGTTAQTITFANLSNKLFTDASPTISSTFADPNFNAGGVYASSGLLVTLNSTTQSVCTISDPTFDIVSGSATFTITMIGLGTCTITADQAGDATYAPATQVVKSFTITSNTLKPTVNTVAASTVTTTAATLNGNVAWGGSNSTTSFCWGTSISLSGCTTVTGTPGSVTAAGTTNISTSLTGLTAGTTYYFRASANNINGTTDGSILSFTTAFLSRTLDISTDNSWTPNVTNDIWGATGRKVKSLASADDTDTKGFTSTDTSICTVDSSGNLTLIKPGTCRLTGQIQRGSRYDSANSPELTFEIGKKDHTLSGMLDTTTAATTPSVSMAATSDANTNTSGLATTTYEIESGTNTAGCSVNSSGTVTYTSAGECYVIATNTGNAYWKTGTLKKKVTLFRANRTVSAAFNSSVTTGWGTTGRTVTATTADDNGDSKTYTSVDTTVCTVDASGNLTLLKPGSCRLTGKVVQGAKFNEATSSEISFTVAKKDQNLVGMSDTSASVASGSTSMAASSDTTSNNSDLATTSYEIEAGTNTAGCTVNSSGTVSYTTSGTCYVIATNSGNGYWNSATTKKQLTLSRSSRTVSAAINNSSTTPWGTSGRSVLATTLDDNSDVKGYTSLDTTVCAVDALTGDLTLLEPGTCRLTGKVNQGVRFNEATSSEVTMTIAKKDQTLGKMGDTTTGAATAHVDMSADTNATSNIAGLATTTYAIEDGTNTAGCVVDANGQVTFTSAGTCFVVATNDGNGYWNSGTIKKQVTLFRQTRTVSAAFNVASATSWGTSGRTVDATTADDNGDAKEYVSIDETVCTVDSLGRLTLLKPGDCKLTGKVVQGARYNAATSSQITLTVDKKPHTLSQMFDKSANIDAHTVSMSAVSDADENLDSLATTTYTISGTDTNSANCSVNTSGLVTFSASGSCYVIATNTGNAYWGTGTIKKKVTVNNKYDRSLTLTTNSASTITWGTNGKSVESNTTDLTADNTDNKSYVSADPDVCDVDASGNLTFKKPGHCAVTSTIIEGTRYNSAVSNTITFTVDHKNRTVDATLNATTTVPWDTTGRRISASTLDENEDDKTYESLDTSVCTVDASGNLTLLSPGTCRLKGKVIQGVMFHEATSSEVSFTVGKKPHNLNGVDKSGSATDASISMAVTSNATTNNSGLGSTAYSLTGTNTAGCSVNSSTGEVTFTSAGECSIHSTKTGNTHWEDAQTTKKLTLNRVSRTVTASFNNSSTVPWGTSGRSVSAHTDDENEDSKEYESLDTSVCTVDAAGNLTLVGPGTCRLKGKVTEGAKYNQATSSEITFEVSKKDRSVAATINNSTTTAWGTSGRTVSAATLLDNADGKQFTSIDTTVCSVDGSGNLTFHKPGTCRLTGKVVTGSRYNEATSSEVTMEVSKKDHTLRGSDKSVYSNSRSVSMAMTSEADSNTSGLASTTYSVSSTDLNSAGCTVDSSGTVTYTSVGECQIEATNTGNSYWNTGTNKKKLTISAASTPSSSPAPSASASPSSSSTSTAQPRSSASPSTTNASGTNGRGNSNNPAPRNSVTQSPTTTATAIEAVKPSKELPAAVDPILNFAVSNNSATDGNTINLGGKSASAVVASSSPNGGERTILGLGAESLSGFKPSTGLTVEIIGARTSGQFLVLPGVKADPIGLSAALVESANRNSTEFAKVVSASSTLKPADNQVIGGLPDQNAINAFLASGLTSPITVGQMNLKPDTQWIKVNANVTTYKPGTVVYLAVTTQPIIFGAALVNRNGVAEVSGYLPVDALPAGGHNIRLVGMRQLTGATTDQKGEVILAQSTLDQIQRFDEGTKATVRVSGTSVHGGINLVIREIPLSKFKPWWTLWFVGWTAILIAFARRYRKILSKKDRIAARVLMSMSTLLPLVYGWVTATYVIMGIGAGIGLLGLVLINVIKARKATAHAAV